MKDDFKGALLQRDGRTFAVTTRIPAGIVTAEQLETIARVGRAYHVPILKITSGQRIVLAGLEPEDVPGVLDSLGPLAKPETAPCVKFVQACLGTDMCRYGKQDSIGLARAIDDTFRNQEFPAKIKVGVSGCPRCCSESHTRDIGIIGTPGGWTIFFGGNARHPATVWRSHRTGSYFPSRLLIVPSDSRSITGAMQIPTNGLPGSWNAQV